MTRARHDPAFVASNLGQVIDDIMRPTPAQEWLERASTYIAANKERWAAEDAALAEGETA